MIDSSKIPVVKVDIQTRPVAPGQLAAWQRLYQVLLAPYPQQAKADTTEDRSEKREVQHD